MLLAGLSLPPDVQVTEVLGGAPAVLDRLVSGGKETSTSSPPTIQATPRVPRPRC